MARKRALVVDDSKSARLVLRKMLERLHFEVDTAESAEEALDYLLQNHPHVIFMDHMMPGMDGFQAVKAIKSDPRTATIPIMMYTSKSGEVYLGEARALGCVGVIPKEVRPADLEKVLKNLRLLPEPELAAVAGDDRATQPPPPSRPERVANLAQAATEDAIQSLLRGRLNELRQQLREDLRGELREIANQLAERSRPSEPPARRSDTLIAVLIVLLLLVPLIVYLLASRQNLELAQAPSGPAAAEQEQNSLRSALAVQRLRASQERARLLETVSWALNLSGQYEFGQQPFADERLSILSDLLARLNSVGFEGVVRLESHVGRFCLVRDADGELRPAPADLPLDRCDSIGFDSEVAKELGSRQSVSFANFVSSSPLASKIRIELVSHGHEAPRYAYPTVSSVPTAGQWNALARRNHRVDVSLISSP